MCLVSGPLNPTLTAFYLPNSLEKGTNPLEQKGVHIRTVNGFSNRYIVMGGG